MEKDTIHEVIYSYCEGYIHSINLALTSLVHLFVYLHLHVDMNTYIAETKEIQENVIDFLGQVIVVIHI